MFIRWFIAVLALPGMVVVFIPATLLLAFHDDTWHAHLAGPSQWRFWLAILAGVPGLALGVWTAALFGRHGEGTAAPWDPPQRFVVRGPYRYVRNPMITGVFAMLLAEAILFAFWPIAIWFTVFIAGNLIYIPVFEEPKLEERFGDDYVAYKARVPRWLPIRRL